MNLEFPNVNRLTWPVGGIVFLLFASLLFANRANTQDQPAAPTVSVDVKVVTLLATVRDKHGQIVRDLTKDDFTLEDDSHPQTIRYFTKENNLSLKLGLMVDTSLSQRRVLDQERSASHSFFDQMLRDDKDMAFVIHFDREVELLQDFTSSRDKLYTALGQLQTPQFSQNNDPQDSRGGRSGHGGGTLLYDAIYLASNELMKKQQGRKALIVLSDGVDHGSKESLETAIESAQRADTLVYSILFKDEQEHGGGGGFSMPGMGGGGMGRHGGGGRPYPQEERLDGKKILDRISRETGARLFEVSKKQPIEQIYSTIEDELRNQYSIGYTPDKDDAGAGYHKIVLKTKQKDLVVQTRDGYYAGQ
jgi:VWFA-related protein